MWLDESVFYQIYPLGFCGASSENDDINVSRINKVNDWTEHIKNLGVNAVYFSPVFQSDRHGYDTRDYFTIDCRLGTNEDFANVVKSLHANGIRAVIDGVFNHVGRGFWAFKDVLQNRQNSQYKDWFIIDFNRNSSFNDGFWYDGWEGHYELVKLNLRNEQVKDHIFSAVKEWVNQFDIDGLRLDVAYCLDKDFLKQLRGFADSLKPDFALIGEMLFGDYNSIVNDEMCHSCTNYECYKGLYSSFNEMNMFEISYSLNRQFGAENWTLYKGKHLLSFVDNHDVGRISSVLKDKNHIPLIYGILFTMPAMPCIYYGSEWGTEGLKGNFDYDIRPCFEKPEQNELTQFISKLSGIHKENKSLCYGGYRNVYIQNRQLVFERRTDDEKILVAVNADENEHLANFSEDGTFTELLNGNEENLKGGLNLPPYSISIWKEDLYKIFAEGMIN